MYRMHDEGLCLMLVMYCYLIALSPFASNDAGLSDISWMVETA